MDIFSAGCVIAELFLEASGDVEEEREICRIILREKCGLEG
jgi:hypothetical protein